MDMIPAWSGHLIYLSAYAILARRAKFSWKQNVVTLTMAFVFNRIIAVISRLGSAGVRYGFFTLFAVAFFRLIWVLGDRRRNTTIRSQADKCSLGVFMGSGGHTAEMKALVSSLDFDRYTPRTYVYCYGDEMSLRVISELENASNPSYHTSLALPRARKVGEGRISTLVSASKTLVVTTWYTLLLPLCRKPMKPWVDVLILNGPGTAVILAAVSWIRRFIGLPWTQIIYVESFARTNSLSLSGKMLRGFVDVFVVQWPEAAGPEPTSSIQERDVPGADRKVKVVHRGWLV